MEEINPGSWTWDQKEEKNRDRARKQYWQSKIYDAIKAGDYDMIKELFQEGKNYPFDLSWDMFPFEEDPKVIEMLEEYIGSKKPTDFEMRIKEGIDKSTGNNVKRHKNDKPRGSSRTNNEKIK